jgi:hypothetical protein
MSFLPVIDPSYLDMEQTFCKVCAIEEIVRASPLLRRRPLRNPAEELSCVPTVAACIGFTLVAPVGPQFTCAQNAAAADTCLR